ncbi:blue-light-activated histidine kinase [Sphingomonas prati]|uniref:histidine kinase n=1 Tax=Sphingomonas prati TaxID=1843237 RepID=A0A7W9BPB5_9SPHN|nr:PAS domain-containing protein [Sphingomonas prati]MBB5727619.1 PAS domain S-box-containing protein [Sphingomonas prati]GGE79419.1 signal transduction histidine kinase [Sphingomonas prati]
MTALPAHPSRLSPDGPAASAEIAPADRAALALIAVERTRMPIVVSDASQPDSPIILANEAFLRLTGYSADEVIGRNCRFLQGRETDPAAVDQIRAGLRAGRDITVSLQNYRKDGSAFWNELQISPIRNDGGEVVYYLASQMDVTDRRQAQQLEKSEHRLLKEVDHRAKNALALVQGIVRLSRSDDSVAYAKAVQGRVDSIAHAHGLLAAGGWRDVDLEAIIRGEMEPFGRQHVVPSGPPVAIAPVQVQPLALVLHEMLSNAGKHGALSVAGGRVVIRWTPLTDEDGVSIDWIETGGPAVAPHPVPGFGWRMLTSIVRSQMRGTVTFDLQPGGLRATLIVRRRQGAGESG